MAGGGSFIALPALLFAGINPVSANATTTMALWPGGVSSAIAYRADFKTTRERLLVLGGVSVVGGLLGAVLLVRTSDSSFMRLLPWLMMAAALTFTFGGRRAAGQRPLAIVAALQFAIAVYGGYFGGGMGIMMLATLAVGGMSDIHEMNGLKAILGAAINGVALVEFIVSGSLAWAPGLVMVGGGIAGGYGGASLARRIDRRYVRRFVIAVAWIMTAYFMFRGYVQTPG